MAMTKGVEPGRGLPPSLQELVAHHGGYDMVPPMAWKEYDEAMAKWNEAYRNDGFGQPKKIEEDAS